MSAHETLEKVKAARAELTRAIDRQWNGDAALRISIPARPGIDSDLVIADGLDAALAALSRPEPPAGCDSPSSDGVHDGWTPRYIAAALDKAYPRNVASPTRPAPPASLVALHARSMLDAYARELMAKNAWVNKSEPWSPESRRMFDTVQACEADTRQAALALDEVLKAAAAPPPDGTQPDAGQEG